jgi:hypothetical protein
MGRRIVCFAVVACLGSAGSAVGQEPLPPKATQGVDHAVTAFRQGKLGDALQKIELVLQAVTDDQLLQINQRLREEHNQELSAIDLAAFCRVELVLAGMGSRLARPPALELAAALEALDDRIVQMIDGGRFWHLLCGPEQAIGA